MPVITLPDGSERQFDNPVSVYDVAANIGSGLAKATLAGRVNDQLVDASHLIEEDASLAIITRSVIIHSLNQRSVEEIDDGLK